MSSEQQILNLIGQYTHYVDQAKFDKVGDLFANGKIIAPGNVMEGKEGGFATKNWTNFLSLFSIDLMPPAAGLLNSSVGFKKNPPDEFEFCFLYAANVFAFAPNCSGVR